MTSTRSAPPAVAGARAIRRSRSGGRAADAAALPGDRVAEIRPGPRADACDEACADARAAGDGRASRERGPGANGSRCRGDRVREAGRREHEPDRESSVLGGGLVLRGRSHPGPAAHASRQRSQRWPTTTPEPDQRPLKPSSSSPTTGSPSTTGWRAAAGCPRRTMAAAASTRPYRVPETGRAVVASARSRSSAVANGARARSSPTTPATSGVETEVAQPTPEPPPSVVIGAQSGRGELDPLAVARERGPLARRRRGGNGDRLGESRRELGSRVRLVPGRRHDEHARGAGTDDGVPQDLGRPLAVDARVDDCGAVVDGVVDRRCGIHVEGDPVRAEHAERHDAAPEARPDAAEAVVRTGGCGSRDGGAMPVASGVRRVRVVVDEVVARADAPARSGCDGSTPESTTAIATSGEPVVTSHAAGRCRAA